MNNEEAINQDYAQTQSIFFRMHGWRSRRRRRRYWLSWPFGADFPALHLDPVSRLNATRRHTHNSCEERQTGDFLHVINDMLIGAPLRLLTMWCGRDSGQTACQSANPKRQSSKKPSRQDTNPLMHGGPWKDKRQEDTLHIRPPA